MSKRIDAAQLKLAKAMRKDGKSWPAIAQATAASERGLRYNAAKNGWQTKGGSVPAVRQQRGNQIATLPDRTIDELAELVKSRLAVDIETSVEALASWRPAELELAQLEKRERVADSVQKRAASLFNIGQTEQPVVNIAVLSQLPDAINH